MAKTKFDIEEIRKAKELQIQDENPTTNVYMKYDLFFEITACPRSKVSKVKGCILEKEAIATLV